jgi:hypothetical protein
MNVMREKWIKKGMVQGDYSNNKESVIIETC